MKSQKYIQGPMQVASKPKEEYLLVERTAITGELEEGRNIIDAEYRLKTGGSNGLGHLVGLVIAGSMIFGGYLVFNSKDTHGNIKAGAAIDKKQIGLFERTCDEIEGLIEKITEVDEAGRIAEVKSFVGNQLKNTKELYRNSNRFFDWRAVRREVSEEQAENNFWEYAEGSKFESKDDKKTKAEKRKKEIIEYRAMAGTGGR